MSNCKLVTEALASIQEEKARECLSVQKCAKHILTLQRVTTELNKKKYNEKFPLVSVSIGTTYWCSPSMTVSLRHINDAAIVLRLLHSKCPKGVVFERLLGQPVPGPHGVVYSFRLTTDKKDRITNSNFDLKFSLVQDGTAKCRMEIVGTKTDVRETTYHDYKAVCE